MTPTRAAPADRASHNLPPPAPSASGAACTPSDRPASPTRAWQPQDGWWYRAATAVARLNPTGLLLRASLVPPLYGHTLQPVAKSPYAQVVGLTSPLCDTVDCRLYACRDKSAPKRLVVGFHGNCSTADSLSPIWRWMSQFGSTLAVNLPGYGNTPAPEDPMALELRMAANVQAVAAYAEAEGYAPGDITWAGISLGGSQAAIGFAMVPGSHALLINTFTQLSHVAAYCARRSLGMFAWPLAWQAATAALPDGWRAPGVNYQTDRLNAVKKLQACRTTHRPAGSRLLVVAAEKDAIMAPEFAMELQHAYYGDDENRTVWAPCIMRGATHATPFMSDADTTHAMQDFLTHQGTGT